MFGFPEVDPVVSTRHQLINETYAAFNRGDLDAAVQHLDVDVDWLEPEQFPAGGRYRGRGGVIEYLDRVRRHWAFVESVPEDIVDVGENDVIVVVHTTARPHDRDRLYESRIADVFSFDGESVVQMRAFVEPAEAFTALGVEPRR
jgi:ketosteroid isomerase-like protein